MDYPDTPAGMSWSLNVYHGLQDNQPLSKTNIDAMRVSYLSMLSPDQMISSTLSVCRDSVEIDNLLHLSESLYKDCFVPVHVKILKAGKIFLPCAVFFVFCIYIRSVHHPVIFYVLPLLHLFQQ